MPLRIADIEHFNSSDPLTVSVAVEVLRDGGDEAYSLEDCFSSPSSPNSLFTAVRVGEGPALMTMSGDETILSLFSSTGLMPLWPADSGCGCGAGLRRNWRRKRYAAVDSMVRLGRGGRKVGFSSFGFSSRYVTGLSPTMSFGVSKYGKEKGSRVWAIALIACGGGGGVGGVFAVVVIVAAAEDDLRRGGVNLGYVNDDRVWSESEIGFRESVFRHLQRMYCKPWFPGSWEREKIMFVSPLAGINKTLCSVARN
ncbi:hypothetical protein CIHG_03102 [Coccidioides immitis H538.4]|uniref:Uncharacterized protein n=1 Tax=Coccidioides immitis H538.4 TaxID=396776 RepID=A0A0J8UDG6_COCIT|nr:hypothetical protein CIHG_03102 [Coccidioides immitis H538.4]